MGYLFPTHYFQNKEKENGGIYQYKWQIFLKNSISNLILRARVFHTSRDTTATSESSRYTHTHASTPIHTYVGSVNNFKI